MESIATDSRSGAILSVRVTPRSGHSRVAGVRHGSLLVKLAAAPVDDAANAALIGFLSACLGIPRRDVRLVSGERSRNKRLAIAGLSAADVETRLASRSGSS